MQALPEVGDVKVVCTDGKVPNSDARVPDPDGQLCGVTFPDVEGVNKAPKTGDFDQRFS